MDDTIERSKSTSFTVPLPVRHAALPLTIPTACYRKQTVHRDSPHDHIQRSRAGNRLLERNKAFSAFEVSAYAVYRLLAWLSLEGLIYSVPSPLTLAIF